MLARLGQFQVKLLKELDQVFIMAIPSAAQHPKHLKPIMDICIHLLKPFEPIQISENKIRLCAQSTQCQLVCRAKHT